MLLASILRCVYWLGARFETSLLIQSLLMIVVQLLLLKVALDHRGPDHSPFHTPFSPAGASSRPMRFWQWRSQRPYWAFLAYFTGSVLLLQLLLGGSQLWVDAIGCFALGIEALLPLPQVIKNQRSRSCRGFRLSVLISWLLGDFTKMIYFSNAEHVGAQFKVCAAVQTVFDSYLGVQFWMFGEGEPDKGAELGRELGVL